GDRDGGAEGRVLLRERVEEDDVALRGAGGDQDVVLIALVGHRLVDPGDGVHLRPLAQGLRVRRGPGVGMPCLSGTVGGGGASILARMTFVWSTPLYCSCDFTVPVILPVSPILCSPPTCRQMTSWPSSVRIVTSW